jgi:hypothetical protein
VLDDVTAVDSATVRYDLRRLAGALDRRLGTRLGTRPAGELAPRLAAALAARRGGKDDRV